MTDDNGVRVEDDGRRWVMWGEIDASVQARAEEHLLRSVVVSGGGIVVDLTDVTFMDSGGLRLLYHAAAGANEPPRLVGTPTRVRDLLELSGVAGLFVLDDAPTGETATSGSRR